ncbi:MAG TPA: ABC transporter substrate-binding protein [Candidatus Binatia bacterium]|nr:ABC transporter substrate-binding protein [Candidatus Binatia bacterium]HEX5022881.1 ABC transporter substrate-binding protein [Candidatus Binatia bacterium]
MLTTLRRKIYAAGFPAVLCLLAVLFSIESSPAQTAEKLIFSIPSRSIAAIDLYIARDRGFFRDEGLDVDIVQIRGNVAIAAGLSGQVQATNGVGTVIRALERSELPMKILTVSLKRNLFWLVSRPEITSIAQLKGKTLGTTTLGGSQHSAAMRLIRKGGVDEKDITVVVGGDVPAQLQSLVGKTIDAAALSPPTVILARDKYNMNVLGSAMEDLANLQNGTAVTEKFLREKRDVLKRVLRARMRANRYFMENERGTSEVLAKYQNVELPVAVESYRLAKPAFTLNGIPSDKEIEEFLKSEAELLKLKEPVSASKIFDFSLQREVNQELGVK